MFNFNKNKVIVDEAKIDNFLNRGIESIFPNKEFLKSKLIRGEKMTFYLGIDPTGPTLHLGHLIPMKKLAELQKLGHQIILLIGDFTATIGDPTDKSDTRRVLTREQVLKNCENYKKQASKFLSFSGNNKAMMKFNSEWLSKMNFEDVLNLASKMTVEQMLKRDMFDKRIKESKPIFIHEFMYPLMQGYDSVAMDVDGELGGNDQTFNMLTGRDLVKVYNNKEKFVVATKLLTDNTGKKMGKTENNAVSLNQDYQDVFGRVMSWDDSLIIPGFEIVTDIPMNEVLDIKTKIENGDNPKEFKVILAKEIVQMLFDEEMANKAHDSFEKKFSKGEIPESATEINIDKDSALKEALINANIVSSNSDWRRLIEGNAVSIMETNEIIKDPFVKAKENVTLRIGKKRFVKIIVK